jgi:F-type H+-transporting ATPase subunit delta
MRDRNVALRYAQALLEVCAEQGVVDGVNESFDGMMETMVGFPGLRVFLSSPQVRTQEKKELIRTVLADRVEPVLLDFVELLIDKDRLMHIGDIHEEFQLLVERHRGMQRATVVTAVPLAEDLAEQLIARLEARIERRIILDKKVDPSVIGGVRVTVGDYILDGTVRAGLDELRATLEKAPLR